MDNRSIIKNPTLVCDDWLYRLNSLLPFPLVTILVVALSVTLTVIAYRDDVGGPITYERVFMDRSAAPYMAWTWLTYTLLMPIFYASVVRCFDQLSRVANTGAAEIAAFRQKIIRPGRQLQAWLLAYSVVFMVAVDEMSYARWSRFLSGDWNILDPTLLFAGNFSFIVFTWFMVIPLSRIILLARFIKTSVKPMLFDEVIGKPLVAMGLRASLLMTFPIVVQTAIVVAIADDASYWSWSYIIPQLLGMVFLITTILVPAHALAGRIKTVKRAELARIDAAIDAETSTRIDLANASSLKDGILYLLDYRDRVDSMPEWPLNLRSAQLFWIYLLIAPLTWLASAIVQVIVENVTFG